MIFIDDPKIVVSRDRAIYRVAKVNRENQFNLLKKRGEYCQTWITNTIYADTPTILPIEFFGNTVYRDPENTNSFYVLPGAQDFIRKYQFENVVEPYAGLHWDVINASFQNPLQLQPGTGTSIFDGRTFLEINPRSCKTFLIQIDPDLDTVTIYDVGGSTTIGPQGQDGPDGPDGDQGDTGARGPQGPIGQNGMNVVAIPRPGYVFLPGNSALQVISPGSYTQSPNHYNAEATLGSVNGLFLPNASSGIPSIPAFTTDTYPNVVGNVFPTAVQSMTFNTPSSYSYQFSLSSITPSNGSNASITSVVIYLNTCSAVLPTNFVSAFEIIISTNTYSGNTVNYTDITPSSISYTTNGYTYNPPAALMKNNILIPNGDNVYNSTDQVHSSLTATFATPVILPQDPTFLTFVTAYGPNGGGDTFSLYGLGINLNYTYF